MKQIDWHSLTLKNYIVTYEGTFAERVFSLLTENMERCLIQSWMETLISCSVLGERGIVIMFPPAVTEDQFQIKCFLKFLSVALRHETMCMDSPVLVQVSAAVVRIILMVVWWLTQVDSIWVADWSWQPANLLFSVPGYLNSPEAASSHSTPEASQSRSDKSSTWDEDQDQHHLLNFS